VGSAFDGAVKPFILWDVLKMAFAAVTVAGTWRLLRKKA
jgi:biotin transport system substrate-specific component